LNCALALVAESAATIAPVAKIFIAPPDLIVGLLIEMLTLHRSRAKLWHHLLGTAPNWWCFRPATPQGAVDYSENAFSVTRALRTAGARNALMTLWKLNDGEARDFMVDFCENWLGQARSEPAKALRDTQRSWMTSENRRCDPAPGLPTL
jgi:CHAT domain